MPRRGRGRERGQVFQMIVRSSSDKDDGFLLAVYLKISSKTVTVCFCEFFYKKHSDRQTNEREEGKNAEKTKRKRVKVNVKAHTRF